MDIEKRLKPYGVPAELIQQIREMVVRDPLTRLYNRRFFDEALVKATAAAKRYEQSLSLILLDVDHFKAINDQHGYAAGDKTLQTFARILTDTCREADIVCRYGGDEFAIILPDTKQSGADRLVQRIQSALPANIQTSAGTATLPAGLLLSAESELHKQKKMRK